MAHTNKDPETQARLVVPGRMLLGLLRAGTAFGASPRRVLDAAGLDVDLAALDEVSWPVEEFHRLIEAFGAEADDPALGLHLGEMFSLFDLRALNTLIDTSATLEAGAAAFARYRALSHPLLRVEVRRGPARARVAYRPEPDVACADAPFYAELSLSFHYCYARWLIAAPIEVHAVGFRHAEPGHAAEVERIFGTAARYGTSEDFFEVDDEVLSRPLRGGFAELHEQAEAIAASELSRFSEAERFAPRVVRVIRENIAEPDFDLERAAPVLAVSTRTLQRRLRDEGTTFSELRDRVRARMAMERIRDPRWTIDAVAESLGYRERASFAHAFARWTGMPPGALRRELGVRG